MYGKLIFIQYSAFAKQFYMQLNHDVHLLFYFKELSIKLIIVLIALTPCGIQL